MIYHTQPGPLQKRISALFGAATTSTFEGDLYALIVPDTNHMSGAHIAADLFKLTEGHVFDTVVLVAPSHEEAFQRINICEVDTYHSPLGALPVNDIVRNELCDEDDDIFIGDEGHFHTSGIDVQLPYLQTVQPKFDIVPIVMGNETPPFCEELGHALGEVSYNRRMLVVACANIISGSDEDLSLMRSYIEDGAVEELTKLLASETVHMEGQGAVLVAMIAARHRGRRQAQVMHLESPKDGGKGYLGAVLYN